jgi:hypothetical protein
MLRGRDEVTYYDHALKFCPSARHMEPLNCSLGIGRPIPHPPFPRGGRAVFPQRPPSGGRKRKRVGSAQFAFYCKERAFHSLIEYKPASTRVKPSEAAGSTEQWGDEGDSAHGLDHTTGKSPSTAREGWPEQEKGASRWREDKARSVRLHRRVRALEKAASLKTLASYFCSLFLFGCLRLLSGARYGNTPCLLLSVRRGARSLPTLA